MKKYLAIYLIVIATLCLGSCSKEKLQQLVVESGLAIMTDGSWLITKFTEGANNTTASFAGWECQFNPDKTAVATKGTTSVTGSWSASITNKTITSKFPDGSGILEKLNGAWQIVKSNSTYGEFSKRTDGVDYVMELTKK